jgi:catechol 2,3-dioxygenase-like lactoylglutathione lyase family enzyme
LGLSLFDHVTIRVSDLEESRRCYGLALDSLGYGDPATDGHFYEWEDFSISRASPDRPVTRNLHVAFAAHSRDEVDAWWRAMTDAGFRDDGAPGPRPQYTKEYYGGFVLDPDGNSVEGVYGAHPLGGENRIDHLWIRVRDLAAQRRFYETVCPVLGFRVGWDRPQRRFHVAAADRSFALVREDPVTENVHLAFPASDNETVEEFHRVALAAGYPDNGAPGERDYHPGYYGAFVLDPDGNNVEAVCHNR